MSFLRTSLALTLLLSIACGDDDGGGDSGPGNDAGPGMDAGPGDAGPGSDAGPGTDAGPGSDAGPTTDAGPMTDAGPTTDAGPDIPVCTPGVMGPCCFDISETIGDVPFVIPDTFSDATPTWNRPVDMCPADELSAEALPFVSYIYCNRGDTAADFRFEVLPIEEDSVVPVIVAYSGVAIPADPMMCDAYNEPLFGIAEVVLTLEPGQNVTIVSTIREAGEGEIQSIAGPAENDE